MVDEQKQTDIDKDAAAVESHVDSGAEHNSAPTSASAPATKSNHGSAWLSVLSILLSLSVAAYLAWQTIDGQYNLRQPQQSSENTQAQQDEIKTEIAAFQQALQESTQNQQALSEKIASIATQLQTRQTDDRDWIMAEVEYLIQLAQYQITFADNPQTAITLLDNANKRLAQIEGSDALNMRREITGYLTELKAMPARDIAGMLAQIEALTAQIPSLPLAGPLLGATEQTTAADQEQQNNSSWKDTFKTTMQGLGKLIVVRRHDEKVMPLLAPDQHRFLVRNLQAEMLKIQWAVLNLNDAVYQQSLQNAKTWLQQYFDMQAKANQQFLQALNQLSEQKLKPQWPTLNPIRQSLNEMQPHRTQG